MSSDRRPPAATIWPFWVAHTCFWMAMFAAAMIVLRAFKPALPDAAWFVAVRVAAGFLITAILRAAAKNTPLLEHFGISKIGLTVGGPLAGAVAMTLAFVAYEILSGRLALTMPAAGEAPDRIGVAARFFLNFAMLGSWSVAYFGTHLLRDQRAAEMRALEAETLAARNELNHLQSQISPHFLFNSLNTILASKHSPDDIEVITQSLAKYLRFLLRPVATLEPLGREIDALEDYLTIQSFRFGDRLSCRIDCDTGIRRIPVLPAMIQPLVENALKYGRHADDQPLEVTIRAHRDCDKLFIEVANTGHWIAEAPSTSTGTGLHTLRRRLLIHGGPEATVTTTEHDGWVRVVIQIPLAAEYAVAPKPAALPEPTEIAG
ncbi:MAG: sensor histidine kinase [Planctomycetia bacterium]